MMQAVVSNGFIPSVYQQAVFNWVLTGKGHAVIKAVPGSGKSTTLIEASKLLTTSNAVFLAFNKAIEVELNEKLQAKGSLMKAQTINSFGFSALRATGKKYKVDGNKYRPICKQYLESQMLDGYNAYEFKRVQKLQKLVSLARMTLVDVNSEEAIWNLCQHQDIEFDRLYEKEEWLIIWKGVKQILAAGELQAKELGIIDFDDQVYLPIIWNLTPEKKDFIFVDESQDLNEARLSLIIRSVNGTGRLLFVGDECQAIYGFSGAGTDSMNVIIARTGATVLPLSICYRCPSSHIELCASIFPGLEARPNAPHGTIETIQEDKLYELVRPGDLVLCRMNAPLVSTCLNLIRNGVRAKVRGSDIGASFISLIKKLSKQYPRLSIATFIEIINDYRHNQAILIGTGDDADMKVAALDDKVDTMLALRDAYASENNDPVTWSMEGFFSYIENFFSDERGPLVVLSTVHKAKGLEENRVFILHPEKMPHPKAKAGWQYEQELNIKYVAFSRSKDALYFVSDKIVPSSHNTEEEDDALVAIAEEIVSQPVITEALQIASETQETVAEEEEVNIPVASTKRPHGGRKPLTDEDKRVVYQQMWDTDIRSAFKEFAASENEKNGTNDSESEILEKLLLTHPAFASFFAGTEHQVAYTDRQARAEKKREPYKNRKKVAKVVEASKEEEKPDPDNNPDGHGGGVPAVSSTPLSIYTEFQGMVDLFEADRGRYNESIDDASKALPLPVVEPTTGIRRVAYTCLRPSCKRSWLTDYHVSANGTLYRYEQSQIVYADMDFPQCPYCKNKRQFIKVRHPKMTHSSTRKCDSRCWNAKPGSDCQCSCSGTNHATGHGGTSTMIGQPLLLEQKQ